MGSRGPKKTSATVRLLHGANQGRARPRDWPFKASLPECPQFLAGYAREHYLEVGPLLRDEGLMCEAYLGPFCLLCSAHQRVRLLDDALSCTAADSEEGIALTKMWDKAAARYMQLANQFGLTPNARGRVASERQPPVNPSGWDQFGPDPGA